MNTLFTQKISNAAECIQSYTRDIERLMRCNALFGNVDLSDIEYVSVYGELNRIEVYLTLKSDRKDSRLPHALTQHFACNFKKQKTWSGESLQYVSDGIEGLKIIVQGAVPATCELRTIEEPLTDAEYEAAVARVQRVRVKREVVCTNGESVTAEVEA